MKQIAFNVRRLRKSGKIGSATIFFPIAAVITLSISLAPIASHAATVENEDLVKSPQTGIGQIELEVWNDPKFRKQFAESYMAETEVEPQVTSEEREQMQEILNLISAERMGEAARRLERELMRNEAASAVFDFTLANIYFQQDQLDRAANLYDRAVNKFAKFRRAWKNLGVIYVRQSEFDKAVAALTKVIETGGNDAITYGLLGYSYTALENYLSAESAYRMAILLDAETLDWKLGLARSFFKQERYAEAVTLTGRLIEQFPDRSDLWLLQANAYIGLNKPLEAAEIYELVDHLGQSTADSLYMLGDIYTNEKLYELAANSYSRAMERKEKGKADRAIRSAKVLAARGAYNETRSLIEKIESIHKENLDTEERKDLLKLQARIAVAEGEAQEEVRVLEEIVELDPLDGEALILLGQHSARTGDTEKAIFYFERAANIEGHEADAKVRHAQLLVKNGKYSEALPLLRRAQQINHRQNIQDYLEQVERIAKSR